MMVDVSWRVNKSRKESHQFYAAQKSHTDYGACCRIFPNLDFINQKTRNLPTDQYTGRFFNPTHEWGGGMHFLNWGGY